MLSSLILLFVRFNIGFKVNPSFDNEVPNFKGKIHYSQDYTIHKLPETGLEVSIPSTFKVTEGEGAGLQADIAPTINLVNEGYIYGYSSDEKATSVKTSITVSIYVVKTDLSPTEWLSDNVVFQGQKSDLETWENSVTTHNIDNKYVVVTHTSCCGGYTPTYLFKTQNEQGESVLLIYTTNATLWQKTNRESGNYFLDYLLASTRESTK